MILNKKDRDEFRKEIAEKLKEVPKDSELIKMDKEVLDSLLFEEVYLSKYNSKVKIPVWSGEFLRKIDLSEVDFTNAVWSLYDLCDYDVDFFEKQKINQILVDYFDYEEEYMDLDKLNAKMLAKGRRYDFNYSYTNANIDLSKAFKDMDSEWINISRCNFRGVNIYITSILPVFPAKCSIYYSDLSYSKLPVSKIVKLDAQHSNLDRIDMSGLSIYARDYFDESACVFYGCSLIGTGLNIEITPEDYDELIDEENGLSNDIIKKTMENEWCGCYINGKLNNSIPVREDRARKLYGKYERFKAGIMDEIDSKIKGLSRK